MIHSDHNLNTPGLRDFSLGSYQLLLHSLLKEGYLFHDLEGFAANGSQKAVFLRHDIDRYTDRVEKFAKLEYSLGIQSTYYFRPPKKKFHYQLIETVVSYKHHIGYHYNDLAENKGVVAEAVQSFSDRLAFLRSFAEVKSICMHGKVISAINNLDLLKSIDIREYGLIGDPYLLIDHQKVLYLTDTSRSWNSRKYNKWDRVQSELDYHPPSTFRIVEDLSAGWFPDRLHLCIHPQHYYDTNLKWTVYYLGQSVKNRVKSLFI